METADLQKQLEQWRADMADKPLQSAQAVQDRLLDLYSSLREYPVKSEVEKWLSLTRERSLFEDREITVLINDIEMELALGGFDADMEPAGA
jgi:hypothetical protein